MKNLLIELDACVIARNWAGNKSVEQVINECDRGDWLLWLASKMNLDRRKLTLAKGLCAKTVEHLMKNEHSKAAVKAAIDYGNGLISEQELANADDEMAASAAAYAADYDMAASAAYAKKENQSLTANICRDVFGEELVELIILNKNLEKRT